MDCVNKKPCPCTAADCSRHGRCCDCLAHHLEREALPACCFLPEVEKTFDRSMARFVKMYQEK